MIRELTEEDLDVGELIDIDEFVGQCITGDKSDIDGYGLYVFENEVEDRGEIAPSMYKYIPEDVTHILWFSC